jgi:hypothetical protein
MTWTLEWENRRNGEQIATFAFLADAQDCCNFLSEQQNDMAFEVRKIC